MIPKQNEKLKSHICFVIPSLSAGGAERVVSILANYLVNNKFKVSIVCLVNNIMYPIDERISFICPDFKIPRTISTLIKVIHYYRKTIKRIKPDVILSYLEFYNEITMLSLIGIKKNIYLLDRNNPFLKDQNVAQTFLRKKLYPKADGVIVQTDSAGKFMKSKHLSNSVLVLPNPLSNITEDWNPSTHNVITCVGRMEIQKNHKYLIKAFSELPNEGWTLQLVGDGSLKKELEKYVDFLQLKNKILFLGLRKDVQYILSKSTIFAFPSLHEGFPNALLEAMAIGVPCISNNCDTGPSNLIINGDNGFLVDVDDIECFKEKLLLLMTSDKLREGFSMQAKKLRNIYAVENISKKLLAFINV